jgi:hypothetical protein
VWPVWVPAESQRAEAEKILSELQRQAKGAYVSPYMIAVIYSSLGQKDKAFELLEKAYQERSPDIAYFLKADLRLDTLRPDPRFQDDASTSRNKFASAKRRIRVTPEARCATVSFLKQIQDELVHNTYRPMPVRKKEIPKDGGTKVRVLSIPAIRDRVVQGALKHILEPIFDADFQSGSYGCRPKRSAHEAVDRVAQAVVQGLTRIIDLDLRAYFDNVQHSLLLGESGTAGPRHIGDETPEDDPEVNRGKSI